MTKQYRISFSAFHTGSVYKDGTLLQLRPLIKRLVQQGIPYRVTDEKGRVVRNVTPTAGGKIRGTFRRKNPWPRGRTPPHLKQYLFKKGHR